MLLAVVNCLVARAPPAVDMLTDFASGVWAGLVQLLTSLGWALV